MLTLAPLQSYATELPHVSLFTDASRYIPGGVNSPVRAFRAVGGEPVFIERASGAYVFGHDGRRYIDYVGSWGPMILGHAHPAGRARRAGARRARPVVRRADADRNPARAHASAK